MQPSGFNKWRIAILLVALAFIVAATLTPGEAFSPGALHPDFWCFACGSSGAADVTVNIALFLPFGIAVSLIGVSPLRALIVGFLLSAAIEGAQHFGVPPNRIASATDLLTNTAGAFLGAMLGWNRAMLLQPNPRVARVLTIAGIVKVVAFLSFTAWALSPDVAREAAPEMPMMLQMSKAPFTPGFGWYHGEVNTATVGGQSFEHDGDGPVILHGVVSQQLSGFVQLFGGDERDEFVPMLYVHDRRIASPELMIGQQGVDAVMRVSLRGQRLRFPSPSIPLRGVFRRGVQLAQTITYAVTPTRWSLTSLSTVGDRSVAMPISLSLGWTLLQTVVHVGDSFGRAVTIVWLALFWLPIGYWIMLASREQNLMLAAAGLVVLGLTLWLVPAGFGIAKATSLDWSSAISGLAIGVVCAMLQRRFTQRVAGESHAA